ncbi:nucleolar complex protein 2 homolog [Cydia fagiglandana]|uniref:nucleolar complex protein 2 homolog n=1 Tax=Cydia fagiglandana TaxID=1458189 RepID=UPI002FEE39C6
MKKERKVKKGKKPVKIPDFEEDGESDFSEEIAPETHKKATAKNGKTKNTPDEEEGESDSDEEMDPETHKKSLEKLKKIDPDFYNFLEENDENLLNFGVESGDEESDGEDQEDEDDVVHKPGPLQADSDESDFEEEVEVRGKITLKMVAEWQEELQSEKKIKISTLNSVIKAFNAAMLRATSDDGTSKGEYKVEGSSVFNAVIQMCVLYLPAAIKKYLGMEQSGKDPQKCKHFVKIKAPLVAYLNDLLKLLGGVTSENILTVLLKHLHQMSVYVACFARISKHALKKLITLWSRGEETVRVLAFLCILRITRNQQANLLDLVLKAMYMTYVKNCKFVSPTTWPSINFMRRSLVEMFTLDLNVSYQHVFLYIRQLAIHLRNAIVVQKVENRQAVYNWQFVNSLHLWADLLGATTNKPQLQPLVYPLVMVITNTIKLVPTHQYYPVRFHCVEILIHLSKESNTFIPILPFLLEVLTSYDFNKKHKKVSMKPLDLSCVLRLAKSQLMENGFKDSVIERIYGLLLEYMANQSHSIAFPDLSLLAIIQIKQFLKTCSVSNYTKKLRQLLEKIEENCRFIERERSKISFSLSDSKLVAAWETNISTKGTPLQTFYNNWSKINKIQKRKKVTKNDDIAGELPMIKRPKLSEDTNTKPKNEGPTELFPSDSEDEKDHFKLDGEDEDEAPRQKKNKKKQSKKKFNKKAAVEAIDEDDIPGADDVVQDLSVNDW